MYGFYSQHACMEDLFSAIGFTTGVFPYGDVGSSIMFEPPAQPCVLCVVCGIVINDAMDTCMW